MKLPICRLFVFAGSFCVLVLLVGVELQTPVRATCIKAPKSSPRLNVILPRGVQRGGEYTLKFSGARLQTAEEIFLYDSGVTVTGIEPIDANNINVTLYVDANCRLGEHVVQVRTRHGISDFRSFYVGALPDVSEQEPNNFIEEAQPIGLDVTVNGTITQEDIDYFRITGKKGQRLSVEIEGIRLGYMFDPAIALLDQDRFEIAVSDDSPLTKQDSYFSVRLPEDGEYFITVRETAFRGDGNSRYRLHVGQFPRPQSVFPAGGKPGELVELKFFDSIKDEAGQFVTSAKSMLLPSAQGARDGLFFEDDRGISPSPLPFRLSSLENVIEQEPNNTWVDTPAMDLPKAINGIIESDNDTDFYKFHAKKGQVWHVTCYARRVGSALDPVINIYDANKKSVVGNDDSAKADSYIRFQAPNDGDYYLRIRDHLRRGQEDFIYRIEIAAPVPELTLGINRIDRYSQQRQTIAVPQGSRFAVLMNASRKDFGGEIELIQDNLLAGVRLVAPPMKSNLNLMPVVFEAAEDAPIDGELVDFRGRHVDAAKNISGGFENRADFVLGQPNNSLYYSCTVDQLAMAVIEPLPFRLELVQPKVPVIRNGSIRLKVIAHRDEGFDGQINLQFPFRSPGIGTTYQIVMPKGKSEAYYPLNANANAQLGKWPMYVIGTSNYKGPAWTSTQMAELEVAEPFVKMEFERAKCVVGQSTKLYCKLEQLVPFEGEAQAKILGIPPNISISGPLNFTSETKELTFDVQTTDKSPVGKHSSLFCQVTIVKDGEPIVGRAGKAVLQINRPAPPEKTTTTTPASE